MTVFGHQIQRNIITCGLKYNIAPALRYIRHKIAGISESEPDHFCHITDDIIKIIYDKFFNSIRDIFRESIIFDIINELLQIIYCALCLFFPIIQYLDSVLICFTLTDQPAEVRVIVPGMRKFKKSHLITSSPDSKEKIGLHSVHDPIIGVEPVEQIEFLIKHILSGHNSNIPILETCYCIGVVLDAVIREV